MPSFNIVVTPKPQPSRAVATLDTTAVFYDNKDAVYVESKT